MGLSGTQRTPRLHHPNVVLMENARDTIQCYLLMDLIVVVLVFDEKTSSLFPFMLSILIISY